MREANGGTDMVLGVMLHLVCGGSSCGQLAWFVPHLGSVGSVPLLVILLLTQFGGPGVGVEAQALPHIFVNRCDALWCLRFSLDETTTRGGPQWVGPLVGLFLRLVCGVL